MSKRGQSGVLNRLAGKKVVLSGRFSYGVKERLQALAEAQQAKVVDDLSDKVDYLVVADLSGGKTMQKKAMTLNGKGASIQTLDADAFGQLVEPTDDEVIELVRAGITDLIVTHRGQSRTIQSENFDRLKLKDAHLRNIAFAHCSLVGADLNGVHFNSATDCDFSKASGAGVHIDDVSRSRFDKANMTDASFAGDLDGTDFSGAVLEGAVFRGFGIYRLGAGKPAPQRGTAFNKATLTNSSFIALHLNATDFSGADLSGAVFDKCVLESANFQKAKLGDAVFAACVLRDAEFSGADLTGANLGDCDLTGANVAGANLKNASFRGAKLDGVDLSKAKNYDPNAAAGGAIGAALTELDAVNSQAKRLQLTFRIRSANGESDEEIGVDSSGLQYGYGVRMPQGLRSWPAHRGAHARTISAALIQLANLSGKRQVRFETVDVSSTKSPKSGKELRELVLKGISEAFAQPIPADDVLAAATKEYRDAEREKGSAQRQLREQAKAEALKAKEKAKKQIAKTIEKTVGKVTDIATFLKALEVRIEKPKIDKATKMLKAERFKLFNDITAEHISGVVKSQTDPDLVYACRVDHEGQYSCCTQNLNVCGGLRGSICKHLLVLIIGLVQAGELDPTTIDGWIAKTHHTKPALDKENMGAIFIKYKGAEAGEVDWRPTETVPEDYYAL